MRISGAVLVELAKDPKLVYHCGLSPVKLPELVEHNPLIVVEILIKLIHSTEIGQFKTCLMLSDPIQILTPMHTSIISIIILPSFWKPGYVMLVLIDSPDSSFINAFLHGSESAPAHCILMSTFRMIHTQVLNDRNKSCYWFRFASL
ncbi:CCR4-NOT transcription complex subunit 11-like [Papaver somniferum]|uniref:CCR4-NOT transcription complex subunit 11-like n=1 Tax=Papaver somniferum TaxID=3469 RepID=UPI000E6FD2C4|nr:CCR4-NOT transcription complex subunit 11-like [Papaver somniferum]